MDAKTLFSFLGYSPSEPDFDAFLTENRVFDRPHTPKEDEVWSVDDRDEDEETEEEYRTRKRNDAERNAEDSLIEEVERFSICLIYDHIDDYQKLYTPIPSKGEFVLKQIAFYAKGVKGYLGYAGLLPWALMFSMSRSIVHQRLGQPYASRIIHELSADLYFLGDFVVNISYLNEGESIGVVHVRKQHFYDLRMLGKKEVTYDHRAIDLQELIKCLGSSAYDVTLESLLEPMGWQSSDFAMADCDEVPNLIRRYGIALYYRPSRDFESLAKQQFLGDGTVFAGFRVNRRGDMHSEGFDGKLPCDLQFHDSPGVSIKKIGKEPDWKSIGDDIGSCKWKLPGYILHVMYSLIDCQIYRVSCFAKFMEAELFKLK